MKRLLIILFVLAIAAPHGAAAAKRTESKAKERTVTIDVNDAPIRTVLVSMQKQCGIKNLVVDPDVTGNSGTIVFRDVPCSTAFKTTLRMWGLTSSQYSNALVHVETRD